MNISRQRNGGLPFNPQSEIRNPKWGAGLWANLVCQKGASKRLPADGSQPVLRMERIEAPEAIEAVEASPER